MELIVKKFGGTSLASGKLIKNAAIRVKNEIDKGNKVIVVVSAMAGATSDLLSLCDKASKNHEMEIMAEIDSVISTGEQVSSGLMAIYLNELGCKARSVLGWQINLLTNNNYGNAHIESVDLHLVQDLLDQNVIPVMAGFQGVNSSNRIATLGRGGSDLTAVYLSHAFSAARCDIYTDVDGVYNFDPKSNKVAEKIHKISYDEMYKMASNGAKVMQKESVETAKKYKVIVKVLSSFSPNGQPSYIAQEE